MKLYLLRMYGDIAKGIHQLATDDAMPDDTDIFLTKDSAFTYLENIKENVDFEDDKLALYEVEIDEEGYYILFDLIWGFWGWHYKIPDNFMQGLKLEDNDNDDISILLMKECKRCKD